MPRKQSRRLASARAYYRLAVKAALGGNPRQGETYRRVADRLVAEDRRNREFVARMNKRPGRKSSDATS